MSIIKGVQGVIKRFLKWGLLVSGSSVIIGALFFEVSFEQSVPKGVDLGIEPFYFLAFLAGGFMVYLSTIADSVKEFDRGFKENKNLE